MLNKVFLQGRLVADPELRHTPTGVAVASFRLAVDRDYKSKQEGAQTADFIDIVAWRGTGEFVSRYFTKGRMALVEGRLQLRSYNDRDGNRRTAAEVVADNVYFGDSKRDSGSTYGGEASYPTGGGSYAPPAQPAPAGPAAFPPTSSFGGVKPDFEDDGELPF